MFSKWKKPRKIWMMLRMVSWKWFSFMHHWFVLVTIIDSLVLYCQISIHFTLIIFIPASDISLLHIHTHTHPLGKSFISIIIMFLDQTKKKHNQNNRILIFMMIIWKKNSNIDWNGVNCNMCVWVLCVFFQRIQLL